MTSKTEHDELVDTPFRLGDWLVEPRLNRLTRGDKSIQIEHKMMDVLVCMAERPGDLVPRQHVIDTVWAIEFISEGTLTRIVAELRRALGDDAREPQFIETIRGKGYRLLVPVEVEKRPSAAIAQFPARESEDDRGPYPGLAAFTEADAEYFFGREAEVNELWRTITSRRLLAVIGPSGVGKTSFLRAGLLPGTPEGWGTLICQPGEAPFAALARALAPEFEGDAEAISRLVDISDQTAAVAVVSRWRGLHDQALLIVDQFEELFTLNPPEVQARFAALIGHLARDVGVHVVLSMRDDFLYRCHEQEPLTPIFSGLVPVKVPGHEDLRRALVEPASRFGYAFEDEDLANEMLDAVAGERGALPLLAFAVERMWVHRDREKKLLTSRAFADIGGVAGALAHHAETTVEQIGAQRLPVIREFFRNLVTAEGTRAIREWNELLSVFSDSRSESQPEEVLRQLIDARLLTSYEIRGEDEAPTRRVEIIHESLLANWPRLVRWQTQDADAAQLRDQLRQAAKTWEAHDRSDDFLWVGSAYRDFAVWRERYPGGLTGIEEAFAAATINQAKRRRRRRRVAVAAVLGIALAVAVMTTALWRRSLVQERRAEAQKLIALGQVQMEDYPTAALAYATQSLGLADSEEARFLALEALWEGPTAFVVNEKPSAIASFSPGGDWLVQTQDFMSSLAIVSRNGLQKTLAHPSETGTTRTHAYFSGQQGMFCSWEETDDEPYFAFWSAADSRLLASAKVRDGIWPFGGHPVIDETEGSFRAVSAWGKVGDWDFDGDEVFVDALHEDGSHKILGSIRLKVTSGEGGRYCLDQKAGRWLALVEGSEVSVVGIGEDELFDRRSLGRHDGDDLRCLADPLGRFFLTSSRSGDIRKWDPSGVVPPTDFRLPLGVQYCELSTDGSHLLVEAKPDEGGPNFSIWSLDDSGLGLVRSYDDLIPQWFHAFDPDAKRLVMRGPLPAHRLWSLAAPAAAEPTVLRRGPSRYAHVPSFSPDGRWLATNDRFGLALWPLVQPFPAVIGVDFKPWASGVAFGPDGRFLATSAGSEVRVWPLVGAIPPPGHVIFTGQTLCDVAVAPNGELFAAGVGSAAPAVWLGRKGEEPLELRSAEKMEMGTGQVSFSADGRLVAAMDGGGDIAKADFHVWDVTTGEEVAVLNLDGESLWASPGFVSDGRLLTALTSGVVALDVETGEHEVLVDIRVQGAVANEDGRRLLVAEEGVNEGLQDSAGSPIFFDLENGTSRQLTTHGLNVRILALDQRGTFAVTGDANGLIRVGPVTGEEPHLLFGHDAEILDLAIDPLGRWIASAGMDQTLRLWPMPDLTKPPLHTLPRDELIAKLKTLTNVRVARDEESPTGWTLTHEPFPGWETVPTW